MRRNLIPASEARSETEVQKSQFIACAAPASSVEQAREFIARMRHEFADATHHVPAYLIGHGASLIAHCHDDGEPSGTAGRPALSVLQSSGLGDIVVVVSRYFGGTKLGTGGLVRAYTEAVRSVLDVLPRAEKVLTHMVRIAVPYALFERTRIELAAHGGQIADTRFELEVTITARLSVEAYPAFESALQELSAGAARPQILETLVSAVPV